MASELTQEERRAAYRIADADPDVPDWTPEPWHGARIAEGRYAGWRGFIVGRCDCCPEDSNRYRMLKSGAGVVVTCVPRAWLRPMPTYSNGKRVL